MAGIGKVKCPFCGTKHDHEGNEHAKPDWSDRLCTRCWNKWQEPGQKLSRNEKHRKAWVAMMKAIDDVLGLNDEDPFLTKDVDAALDDLLNVLLENLSDQEREKAVKPVAAV